MAFKVLRASYRVNTTPCQDIPFIYLPLPPSSPLLPQPPLELLISTCMDFRCNMIASVEPLRLLGCHLPLLGVLRDSCVPAGLGVLQM